MSESNPDIIDIPPEAVVDRDQSPVEAKQPPKRLLPRLALGAAVVAASAVGGGWVYRDYLSTYLPSDSIKLLNQRVEALDASNKATTEKLQAVVGVTDEIKAQADAAQSAVSQLSGQIVGLKEGTVTTAKSISGFETALNETKARIADLQASAQNGSASPSAGVPAALEQRLAAVEKDVAALKQGGGLSSDTTALSQGLADLKGKVEGGMAYGPEFERIHQMVPAADGLDVLAKYAPQGVATLKDLQQQLKGASAQLQGVEKTPAPKDDSWSGWIWGAVSNLVSVRDQATPDWQVLSQKASAFLDSGDMGQASGVFENLPVAAPESLAKWHEALIARLAVDAAMTKVSAAVLRQIASKG